MTLYDIDAAILACVDMETGDVVDIDKLNELEMERDAKISGIACWVKDLKAEAEALKAEKQNLEKRQKAAENKAESLKTYLQMYLGGGKYKDSKVSISYRKSTATIVEETLDVNQLPDELKKVKVEPMISAIKERLLAGEQIEGCHLEERNSIQIR